MKAVIVTGATTPLGEGLVLRILERGLAERVLAVAQEPQPSLALRARPEVTYAQVNFARDRDIRALLFGEGRALGAEAIVHTALHRRATSGGARIHRQNVESTRLLLELCARHPTLRHFIFRSYAEVYRVQAEEPDVLHETHPLVLSDGAPQWIRDRVEADLLVCTHMGMSPLRIVVLRCAEILAPDVGSQLADYLRSRVALRPLGYDPMINLLSLEDAIAAHLSALASDAQGVFNIPGADTLPLSLAIRNFGRLGVPVPGELLGPLYRLRAFALGTDFRYDLNHGRLHYSGVLDGRRAAESLGYQPLHGIAWPRAG